ncbi:MAG: cell division protein FtsB [Gammaproteobacteria bacterium]|nr:cell division protein FtsB [Gammaproteobacteria bacterium]
MKWLLSFLILLLLLLQFRLWFSDSSLLEIWKLQQQIAEQNADNSQLKERNAALQAEVKDLKQGLQAIEERARSELGLIKKGETFYQVIDDK